MAERSCSGRGKKEIMDIKNSNCGQAPSSKNNEIFFVISGILTVVNNLLLIIIKNPIHKPKLQS
jgi:hypothetical protein